MPNDKQACPHCGVTIPTEAMRKNRPFSCPSCKQIVASIDTYNKYGLIGCLSFPLLSIAVAIFVGYQGSRGTLILSIVVGVLVGIVGGFVGAIAVIWGLQKFFPRAPRIGKRELCDSREMLLDTANFLDSVRELPEWSWEENRGLDSLWRKHFPDDNLEVEALMAAQEFKARLTKSWDQAKHVSDEIKKLNLSELREELAAIAADLRLAAK